MTFNVDSCIHAYRPRWTKIGQTTTHQQRKTPSFTPTTQDPYTTINVHPKTAMSIKHACKKPGTAPIPLPPSLQLPSYITTPAPSPLHLTPPLAPKRAAVRIRAPPLTYATARNPYYNLTPGAADWPPKAAGKANSQETMPCDADTRG